METVILKIGGALVTDKDSEVPLLDEVSLGRIAAEISESYNKKRFSLVLVNGAGSYGHPFCMKTNLGEGIKNENELPNFAKDQSLMNELNVLVCNALIERGVPAIPFQPSTLAVMENKQLIKFDTEMLERLLKLGMVPCLFGTAAYDSKQGCSILSGDQIISFIASKLNARKIIFATDVDGIFNENPKVDKNAQLIKNLTRTQLELISIGIGSSSSVDVTSGMFGKVKEILKMKNLDCFVISGRKPGNIKSVLLGNYEIGTRISL